MKNIAIITGGENGEREVSLKSAKNFYDNLDSNKYNIDLYDFPIEKNIFLENYKKYDLVVPYMHGVGGEDGEISNMAKFLNIPYLFSTPEALQLTLDKFLANIYVEKFGIKIPKTFLIENLDDIKKINFSGKIFVKPCNGGSSVDNGVFENIQEANNLIKNILKYDTVLVQEYIKKDREFSVSLYGDYDKEVKLLAISEVITQKEAFDFEAKYSGVGAIEVVNAENLGDIEEKITDLAKKIYKLFKLKTYARIDFLYANGELYFLEANTIPGFTKNSFVPQAILAKGYKIGDFLEQFIV